MNLVISYHEFPSIVVFNELKDNFKYSDIFIHHIHHIRIKKNHEVKYVNLFLEYFIYHLIINFKIILN